MSCMVAAGIKGVSFLSEACSFVFTSGEQFEQADSGFYIWDISTECC